MTAIELEPYILPLDQVKAEHASLVGGKAVSLGELCRAGVRVPPGFCLTTAAYRSFLEESSLEARLKAAISRLDWGSDLETQVRPLQDELKEQPFPLWLSQALEDAQRSLGESFALGVATGFPVAVRSSATHEDLPEASFAGQFDTYLNVVSLRDVEKKVIACWSSLFNPRALAYLHHHNVSPLETAMAVIVQQQVPAEASGVLFTLNPLTGREEEMLVEASWGLGQAVVSGKVTPDRYVLDAWDERIHSREISEKRVMVAPDWSGGVHEVEVPVERRTSPALTDRELLELLQLGYQIQVIYGYPQDVEWALWKGKFYILQARPMTTYTFAPDIGQWTSANFREVMPGLVTPLPFSNHLDYEWGKALEEFFTRTKMMREKREVRWGRMFFSHAYWNMGEVKRVAAIVPGFKERSFDQSAGVEIAYEGDGLTTPWTPKTILHALPCLFALQKMYQTFWKEAEAYRQEFSQHEAEFARLNLAELSNDELAEQAKRVFEFHYRTNRVALLISFLNTQAQDDFSQAVEALNRRNPDTEPISMSRLLTGLTRVSTGRPIIELWKVSQEALKHHRVAELIMETEPTQLPEKLQSFPEGRTFWEILDGFIREFRYLGESDEDWTKPRLDEDPGFVLTALRGLLREGVEVSNPENLIAQQREVRLQEERRAAALLSIGLLNRFFPFRKGSFFSQLETLKRYCWWREETRPWLGLAHYHCRRLLVELDRRWVSAGYIAEPGDIFFLTRDLVLAALEGKLSSEDARAEIRRHKRLRTCYRNFTPPSTIGKGAKPQTVISASGRSLRTFVGVSCSPGKVTGRAKVLRSLDEAGKLGKGEIIVAPSTNPGWTPLFNLAAGIVTEEGGLISHGAIVAREYGIPAVLQIREATKLFSDGDTLCIDGERGMVELLDMSGSLATQTQ